MNPHRLPCLASPPAWRQQAAGLATVALVVTCLLTACSAPARRLEAPVPQYGGGGIPAVASVQLGARLVVTLRLPHSRYPQHSLVPGIVIVRNRSQHSIQVLGLPGPRPSWGLVSVGPSGRVLQPPPPFSAPATSVQEREEAMATLSPGGSRRYRVVGYLRSRRLRLQPINWTTPDLRTPAFTWSVPTVSVHLFRARKGRATISVPNGLGHTSLPASDAAGDDRRLDMISVRPFRPDAGPVYYSFLSACNVLSSGTLGKVEVHVPSASSTFAGGWLWVPSHSPVIHAGNLARECASGRITIVAGQLGYPAAYARFVLKARST